MRLTESRLRRIIREELEQATSDKRKIFVLIGPPSVGKSTWISKTFEKKPYVISRDDIVESVAASLGLTYDDLFVGPPVDAKLGDQDDKYGEVVESPSWMTWQPLSFDRVLAANNDVQAAFKQRVAGAIPSNSDVVVDMTNMNARARKGALAAISGSEVDFDKIAVVFEFEGAEDVIKRVAAKRAAAAKRMGKSKTIPPAAFDRMFSSFQRVTGDEGFDEVVSVDNRAVLKQLANETNESVRLTSRRLRRLVREELSHLAETKEDHIAGIIAKIARLEKAVKNAERGIANMEAGAEGLSGDEYHYAMMDIRTKPGYGEKQQEIMNLEDKLDLLYKQLKQLKSGGSIDLARGDGSGRGA
jgi:hypothetical protein